MVNKFEKRHSIDFSLVLLLFIKFALFSASETDILEHLSSYKIRRTLLDCSVYLANA